MKDGDKPMRRLTIAIPEEYVAGLEDMAEDMGASVSEAVREAVVTYLMENYWKESIGGIARKAILNGATNEEALSQVRKKFPRAATSFASIQWYRTKLRKDNPAILTDRQARSAGT
jgi:metal-responsive CopG/Arc/MetJ family transcriptional regulator